jgi:hypothetical protein
VALRLTGLTNLLYEVAARLRTMHSLWPVYSKGLPLELTAKRAWLIHTISFVAYAMTANYRATLSEYQHVSKPLFGLVEW